MPYSFVWLSIDPPAQSSVEGAPEWRRNEIRDVTMAIVVPGRVLRYRRPREGDPEPIGRL